MDAKVIVVFALLKFVFDIGIHFKINVVMLYIILMHICYFMFFANDLLLGVYFIFILDMRMMLDKKQI